MSLINRHLLNILLSFSSFAIASHLSIYLLHSKFLTHNIVKVFKERWQHEFAAKAMTNEESRNFVASKV